MSNSLFECGSRPGIAAALLTVAACNYAAAAEVNPRLLNATQHGGTVDTILVFPDQSTPTLAPLRTDIGYRAHRRALVAALRSRADNQQRGVRAWLDAKGIQHRDYWIANIIEARLNASELRALTRRGDISRIEPNPQIANPLPQASTPQPLQVTAGGITWGVAKIEAPAVWSAGDTGQGVVIGGEDTGYQWNHPALQSHYRGWNGVSADHNYNWHDAIHDSTDNNPCGNDSQFPCDDRTHGTHTMGTMVGDTGQDSSPRYQIGVAPGAKWIGCRNMDEGTGTPTRYIECMQWMLAPYALDDPNDLNPNPDLAPDIVNNSWTCPGAGSPSGPSEGCDPSDILQVAVSNLVNAGIFYVAAAENNGSGCSTITDPPAIYDDSFDVGATDSTDALASFSSRGPVTGSSLVRPDVVAPGVDVYSSIPTDSYGYNMGTSMAAPHVAGTAALLLSAFPALKGHPHEIGELLRETAVQSGVTDPVSQTCGGISTTTFPNYALGYGRVDAWNAYHEVIFIDGFDN